MKFMMIIKSSMATEAGAMPSLAVLDAMGRFNEDMVKAGVLKDAAGLMPSNRGARVRTGDRPSVTDGPFAEARELVAGYWIIDVASLAEAVAWAKRCPGDDGGEIEIRQMFEPDSFAEFTRDTMPEGLTDAQMQDRYGMPPKGQE